ncbi:MAG: exosortase/archaeosortase family protein [Planctomycetes bacterium]|nr:exosortase/archaeosortase family protein [Planctomycetota bacterium]
MTQPQLSESSAESVPAGPESAPRSKDVGWIEYLGPIGIAKIAALVGVLGWFYLDHLKRMSKVWQQPDWSHGYLVPVFALYLIHQNRRKLLDDRHEGSLAGLALIIASLALYVSAVMTQVGYPQPLTIVFVIAGLVLLMRGWESLKLTWFPLAFLFLAIPPPDRLYKEITQPLQQFAALVAKHILTLFPGVREIERAGFNIAYYMENGRDGTFTVAGACSGMRSLMAFVAIGLAVAYMTQRPIWHRLMLAACVVPVALFCNIARVIITGSLQMYDRGNLATGTPHTILGLVMFGIGFSIYMGMIWILDHVFVEDTEVSGNATERAGDAA